jgi:hypothetical protein
MFKEAEPIAVDPEFRELPFATEWIVVVWLIIRPESEACPTEVQSELEKALVRKPDFLDLVVNPGVSD